MPNSGYFDTIFGSSGDLIAVPDPIQIDGSISYAQGWGADYELDESIPGALDISRAQTNQLFFDITSAIQQYQQHGTPPFITSAMNGGSPFSYGIGDRVIKSGVVYTSIAASNTSTPPSANWAVDAYTAVDPHTGYQIFPSGLIVQWVGGTATDGSGTVNTLPITFPNNNAKSFVCYAGVGTAPPGAVEIGGLTTTTVTCCSNGVGSFGVSIFAIGY